MWGVMPVPLEPLLFPSGAPSIPSPDWSCRADRGAGSPIVFPIMPASCRSPRTWSPASLAPTLFEERPDLASQFLVLAAGLPKENSASGGLFFQSGMVELFDLPPTFRAHGACPAAKAYHRVRQVDIERSLHEKKLQIDYPSCLDFPVSPVREETMSIAGQAETAPLTAIFQARERRERNSPHAGSCFSYRLSASPKEKTMKTQKSFVRFTGMLSPAICMLLLGVSAIAQQPTITTIDAPHAGALRRATHRGDRRLPGRPNRGASTRLQQHHARLCAHHRRQDHYIRRPGRAHLGLGALFPTVGTSPGTYASSDACGMMPGYFVDSRGVAHGYLRAVRRHTHHIRRSGRGPGSGQGTFAGSMSLSGDLIAGYYSDSTGMNHGFVRAADGTITKFDVPGAATGPGLGTTTYWAQCINPAGAITGSYMDQNGAVHAFVRTADGTIAKFDAPGAGVGSGQGTYVWAINPAGTVAGTSRITTTSITACCALPVARSLYLTFQAQARAMARVPRSRASTRQAP